MKYILTQNQYNLLIEAPKKWGGKTPEQAEKEIIDFVIKKNIKGRKQFRLSSDHENGWGMAGMFNASKEIKVSDKDGKEITLLEKLFPKLPEKTDEEKIKEIIDFVIKNKIKGRDELMLSKDIENGWGTQGMYDAAKILKVFNKDGKEITLLYKLFPKSNDKTDEQKIKEITDFVIKNKLQGRGELSHSKDIENGWGTSGMYDAAKILKVFNKDGKEVTLLEKLFPKSSDKTDEQKIKEITDFVIKNKLQGRSELYNSKDIENGWVTQGMYRVAKILKVSDENGKEVTLLDELFQYEKKEWLGERKVSDELKKIGYEIMRGKNNLGPGVVIKQFTFNDCFSPKGTKGCHKLKMDFYLITDNNEKIVIEFNGIQHYVSVPIWGGDEGLKYRQECDKVKADYCKQNGIRLIVIPYWEINNIEKIITSQVIPHNKLQEGNTYIKNKIMAKKIVRLTESDLTRLVKRVVKESEEKKLEMDLGSVSREIVSFLKKQGIDRNKLVHKSYEQLSSTIGSFWKRCKDKGNCSEEVEEKAFKLQDKIEKLISKLRDLDYEFDDPWDDED